MAGRSGPLVIMDSSWTLDITVISVVLEGNDWKEPLRFRCPVKKAYLHFTALVSGIQLHMVSTGTMGVTYWLLGSSAGPNTFVGVGTGASLGGRAGPKPKNTLVVDEGAGVSVASLGKTAKGLGKPDQNRMNQTCCQLERR